MGYTTDFYGGFEVTPTLNEPHRLYLKAFNETRRMKRDPEIAATLPDPLREAVGLPIGPDGAYFVGGIGYMGQDHDTSVVDYNQPPGITPMEHGSLETFHEQYETYLGMRQQAILDGAQPGLWCQWVPTEDGTGIVWDGGEKFYDYVEWLRYLIHRFLAPWGYKLSGEVEWEGEDHDDFGKIVVNKNQVEVFVGHREYAKEEGATT